MKMKGKIRVFLRLEDERDDISQAADEEDEEELNGRLHEILDRYLGAEGAGSEEICAEFDLKDGRIKLIRKGKEES